MCLRAHFILLFPGILYIIKICRGLVSLNMTDGEKDCVVELNTLLMKQGDFIPLPKWFLGKARCIVKPHAYHGQNTCDPEQQVVSSSSTQVPQGRMDAGSFILQWGHHKSCKQNQPCVLPACLFIWATQVYKLALSNLCSSKSLFFLVLFNA